MENNELWINYEEWRIYKEYTKYLESKWWALAFYGIHPGQYPEFKEFKSSNIKRSVPFKNSIEVLKRPGYTTLLSKQKGSDLLQNKGMYVPENGTFTITLQEPWDKARQDWYSLCKTNEIKI